MRRRTIPASERVDIVVIGAGVIGLAVAKAMRLTGQEVLVLEAERDIGAEVSARSSKLIRGGLYHPPGSPKAKFCVEGNGMLDAYCVERDIGCERCDKLIAASHTKQIRKLERP